jgi:hypothetical protein
VTRETGSFKPEVIAKTGNFKPEVGKETGSFKPEVPKEESVSESIETLKEEIDQLLAPILTTQVSFLLQNISFFLTHTPECPFSLQPKFTNFRNKLACLSLAGPSLVGKVRSLRKSGIPGPDVIKLFTAVIYKFS